MSIELQRQINDLNERLNKLSRVDTPMFWDGTNVGIGGTPNAKFDVVNGTIRARNGTNVSPTSGSGVEILMTGSLGYIQSYNRTGSAFLPLNINGSGVDITNPTGSLLLNVTGVGSGASSSIELGASATGSRYAYIDLHGDDTYTDYSSRFIRQNTGVNAVTSLQHRGTGNFTIDAVDAASILLTTAGVTRLTVNATSITTVGRLNVGEHVLAVGNFYPTNQGTYYLSWDGSTSLYTNGNFRSAANFYPGNQTTYYLGYNGSNGLTTNGRLDVSGDIYWGTGGNVLSAYINQTILTTSNPTFNRVTISNYSLFGNTAVDYLPTTGNWSSGGTTLLVQGNDYSSIGFHDAGSRVDFIVGGGGVLRLGYDGGWGAAVITVPGSIRVSASGMYIGSTGTAPSYLIHLASDSAGKPSTSTWSVVSDSRTKNKVTKRENVLSRMKQLQVKDFEFNGKFGTEKDGKGVGVVAEDLQVIYPNAVKEIEHNNEDGTTEKVLTVNYHELFVDSLIAIQELTARLELLESKDTKTPKPIK